MEELTQLRVVGVEILYPVNLGYIARVMGNFGFKELYLVNVSRDILRESLKYCAHARGIIENAENVRDLGEALLRVDLAVGTTAVPGRSRDNLLRRCIPPSRLRDLYVSRRGLTALVLGRESTGLSNDELNQCDLIVNIPANQEYPTLNVAQAAAILLYELYQGKCPKPQSLDLAGRVHLTQILRFFSGLCEATGIPPHKSKAAERALRNILYRASPSLREASALLTPLRRAASMIKNPGKLK
ncbi:MAG: TrmJ/YjtD family RNA methyltransferase [Candidatus Bathyarchaeia archaeon]